MDEKNGGRTPGFFSDIAVIGAGPAGMMAAGYATELGASVTLYEKNSRTGRKLMITGKGRCNVTNNCSVPEFIPNVRTNSRFLYSALNFFTPSDTMDFFESRGVPLKTERGRRVFPVSDKSLDIAKALDFYSDKKVYRRICERVIAIEQREGGGYSVFDANGKRDFRAVIIATGGVSYPQTGSDGDGYAFAEALGIKTVAPKASLVPLECKEGWVRSLRGLTLKNITLELVDTQKDQSVFSEMGEMMFTHFGITGPLVLSASCHLCDMREGRYMAYIDTKPALDHETLDARLRSDFEKYKNRSFSNSLTDLFPSAFAAEMVKLSGIDPNKKVNSVTREERQSLVRLFKAVPITVLRKRPISEAIITQGGVDVKEIDPKSMMSKKHAGLFFAGELLDVDAYTGGYNLQIAFSSGRLAGAHAAEYVKKDPKG